MILMLIENLAHTDATFYESSQLRKKLAEGYNIGIMFVDSILIGCVLIVYKGQLDNTIRVLSKLLGRDYNEQHLHDMHNSLFGSLASGPKSGRGDMPLGNILAQLTTFIHEKKINRLRHLLTKLEKMLNT